MVAFTSDQWVIVALVFVLGLLIGAFLTAGGRRKWKARYREEADRREALEREHRDTRAQWDTREKEWREQDSLRAAAIKENRRDPTVADRRDIDADGVPDAVDRRPTDDRKA
ncbi:MAG: LapA family protein [Sphingomicrobium sp.]